MNAICGMVELVLRTKRFLRKKEIIYMIFSRQEKTCLRLSMTPDFSRIDSGEFKIVEEPMK